MYDLNAVKAIKDFLISKNETISIAESVTSGHLQAAVSLAPMATSFFQGGITAYNINEKTKILHIDAVHALGCNCVSEKVASEMAIGAAKLFQSDWALAITGYAAPVPELGINGLFAYWAASHKGEIISVEKIMSTKAEALTVQIFYANEVLKTFQTLLTQVRQ